MMRLRPRSRFASGDARTSHISSSDNEARRQRTLDGVVGGSGSAYPTAPAAAMLISISRFISTAYSIGSSLTIGSMNPATIIEVA